MIWPTAPGATLTVETGASTLDLPLRALDAPNGDVPVFDPPATPAPLDMTWLRPVERAREIHHDVVADTVTRTYLKDDGAFRIEEHGMELDVSGTLKYSVTGDDPTTAKAEIDYRIAHGRGEWRVALDARLTMTATDDHLVFSARTLAKEAGEIVETRDFDVPVARKWL